jgi:hypothetical protein
MGNLRHAGKPLNLWLGNTVTPTWQSAALLRRTALDVDGYENK